MLVVLNTQERESQLRRDVKQMWTELHEKTKVTIEQMPIEQALTLLEEKWLEPILKGIAMLPINMLFAFIGKLKWLGEKYKNTFSTIGEKIESTEKAVSTYVGSLTAGSYDLEGLTELKAILGGLK